MNLMAVVMGFPIMAGMVMFMGFQFIWFVSVLMPLFSSFVMVLLFMDMNGFSLHLDTPPF